MQLLDRPLWSEDKHFNHESVVHLWCIRIDGCDASALPTGVLSDEESTKIACVQAPLVAQAARTSRVLLRLLLSYYTGQVPREMMLLQGRNGKPYLAKVTENLQFNVTHTEGLMLVALGQGMQLGVDCEYGIRQVRYQSIAKKQFSPEEYQWILDGNAEAKKRFWHLWVAKEACLKVGGMGLTMGLDAFQFIAKDQEALILCENPRNEIATFAVLPEIYSDYHAAFAANKKVEKLIYHRISANDLMARLSQCL